MVQRPHLILISAPGAGPNVRHLPPAECVPTEWADAIRPGDTDWFPPATFQVVFHVWKGRSDGIWNSLIRSTNI